MRIIHITVCNNAFEVLRNFGLYPTVRQDLQSIAPWLHQAHKLFISNTKPGKEKKGITELLSQLVESTNSLSTHTKNNLYAHKLSSVDTQSIIHFLNLAYIHHIDSGAFSEIEDKPIFPDKGVFRPAKNKNEKYPFDNIQVYKNVPGKGAWGDFKIQSLHEITMKDRDDSSPITLLAFAACCLTAHLDETSTLKEVMNNKKMFSKKALKNLVTMTPLDDLENEPKKKSAKKSKEKSDDNDGDYEE